jgi:site-specific DNA recombinase
MEEFIEHALAFLANPWNLYEKGEFTFKRTVLKLAFAEPLRYSRNEGYRTAKTTFPFKVLADFSTQKCGMVEPRGIEPLTSCMPCKRSPN